MWTSNKIETYPKQFDFTSSEQGKPTYTAIKIGEYEFSNLIESIEIGNELNFQNIICDCCGSAGCASGNWLTIRKSDKYIFFIPNFEDMKDVDFGANFEPSYYIRVNGSLFLGETEYKTLNNFIRQFPKFENLQIFSKEEIINLYKWDVPQKMFGNFPEFSEINQKRILVTSEFENQEIEKIIYEKIYELKNCNSFALNLLENPDQRITIYLDDKKTTEWHALYKEKDRIGLLLGGKFKITTE